MKFAKEFSNSTVKPTVCVISKPPKRQQVECPHHVYNEIALPFNKFEITKEVSEFGPKLKNDINNAYNIDADDEKLRTVINRIEVILWNQNFLTISDALKYIIDNANGRSREINDGRIEIEPMFWFQYLVIRYFAQKGPDYCDLVLNYCKEICPVISDDFNIAELKENKKNNDKFLSVFFVVFKNMKIDGRDLVIDLMKRIISFAKNDSDKVQHFRIFRILQIFIYVIKKEGQSVFEGPKYKTEDLDEFKKEAVGLLESYKRLKSKNFDGDTINILINFMTKEQKKKEK